MSSPGIKFNAKEFAKGLARAAKATGMSADNVVAAIGAEAFRGIKDLTPVRTGNARAGWQIVRGDGFVKIFNRVVYIVRLEYGHSDQAPNGMVQVTMNRVAAALKARFG